jgi:DNA-binding cell septation regulator SpoVG
MTQTHPHLPYAFDGREALANVDIRIRTWVRGTADDKRSGLLGYLSLFYGSVVIDGVTLRRTAEGRLALSFPERRDGKGRSHSVVRPIDDVARRAIEAAVFGQAALASEVQP